MDQSPLKRALEELLEMDVVRQVRAAIARYEMFRVGDTVVVGVSGGPDSLCLLHVIVRLASEYRVGVQVGHLNHGIRGQAAREDARFVAALCAEWGIPCRVERRDVPELARARGTSLEEAARQERYAFLGELARAVGGRTVAVGHNADDQVETVLMHFLRGSGLAGLRGMPPVAWLDALRLGREPSSEISDEGERIRLVRPLLSVPRAEIERYCAQVGLTPRFDRSNLDQTFARNRVRHELIPLLESYNPNIREVLPHTAEALSGDYQVLRQLVQKSWDAVVRHADQVAVHYDLEALRALPLGLQRSLLREGIHRLRFSLRNINWVHVEDAVKLMERGQVGARATLPRGLELTLGYDEAVLASQGYTPTGEERPRIAQALAISLPGCYMLPHGRWRLAGHIMDRDELPEDWERNCDRFTAYLEAGRLQGELLLRPRQSGDWFYPLGLGHRQSIRTFMINAKIPAQERDTVPLLIADPEACAPAEAEIVWVVGWRIDARYAISADTRRVMAIHVQRIDPDSR
ncbi:MAG: tRNA lysidine(34) synthetase TilS [Anaerolineae bacterium]|nr:tRNA lysidine(34) synthetase TilS [Anaerolineae bacterium]